ncbi:MAG: PadR family transcriptional regulator [Candidatus Thermoplasmatota archaeon]|nr:PadR family transcriptional regulator [Candidatus Thermoplasmatota archaeon]
MEEDRISLLADNNILFLNKLKKGETLLFLYGQKTEKHELFKTFIKNGLENNEFCLYASTESNKWHPEYCFKEWIEKGRLTILNLERIGKSAMAELDKEFRNLCSAAMSGSESCRLLADFASLINRRNIGYVKDFEESVIRKCQYSLSTRWTSTKYKYKIPTRKNFPLKAITAFMLGSLDEYNLNQLIYLHNYILISADNGSIVLTENAKLPGDESSITVVPQATLEEFVKNNLEIIVLSMLSEKALCGYDIIKGIAQKYYTFLSQGTVYPLLYSLQERGILSVEAKQKSKLYSPTEKGIEIIEKKLDDFIKAQEYTLGSLKLKRCATAGRITNKP